MDEQAKLERCVGELLEACLRDRCLFESIVKVLMCTVDFEDRLAKRRRIRVPVKTSLALLAPASSEAPADGSREELPLFIAFETVGGVVYIADKGSETVMEARGRGVTEIPAEVYMPPYRLPGTLKLTIERRGAGWITVTGGTPPQISVPVGSEEHLRALLQLLELRGVKLEVR